jgi:uroporphyrinogen-III synthase
MRVLVTRPAEDAEATAAELVARGHEPVIAPLVEIRLIEGPHLDLDLVQAVLATSRNGMRALSFRTARRDIPILAVGAQTAAIARTLGFLTVKDAGGDAHALARAVLEWTRPEQGPLLHATGAEHTRGLPDDLTAEGYSIRSVTLYEAAEVRQLPTLARKALEQRLLGGVLIFSPRSARILADRVCEEGLVEACNTVSAYAISAAAAEPLKALPFQRICWTKSPNRQSLLALLDDAKG